MSKNTISVQTTYVILFLFVSFLSIRAQSSPTEKNDFGEFTENIHEVRARFGKEAKKLFINERWEELEELLDEARESQSITPSGYSVFGQYVSYITADMFARKEPDQMWLNYLGKLARWEKEIPDSLSVKGLAITFWVEFAEHAKGYRGERMTDENQKLYKERLAEAAEVFKELKETYPKGIPCAYVYEAMIPAAFGLNWVEDETLNELITPVVKLWPEYLDIYVLCARFLQPRGDASSGKGYRFLNKLKEDIGGESGKKMSALGIFHRFGESIIAFQYDLVKWEDMKAGLLAHIKANPHSGEMIRNFIVFGTRYETAAKLTGYVAEASPEAYKKFSTMMEYGKALSATLESERSSASFDYYFRTETSYFISDIGYASSHKDLDYYVCSQVTHGIIVVNSKDGEIIAVGGPQLENNMSNLYYAVELSPSGKYIFASVVIGGHESGYNAMFVYEYSEGEMKQVKKAISKINFFTSASFSEDETTILLGGPDYIPAFPENTKNNRKKGKKGKKGKSAKNNREKKQESKAAFYKWEWETKEPEFVHAVPKQKTSGLITIPGSSNVFCYSGKDCFSYDYKAEKPTPKTVSITFDGEVDIIKDAHYAKELDSIALLCEKGNRIALIDPKTYKPHYSQKDIGFANQAYKLTGFQGEGNEYTFCVTGKTGYMSLCHYVQGDTQEINYESTWVNIDYDPTYVGLAKGEDGGVRIVQTYKGGMIGAYSLGESKKAKNEEPETKE